MEIFARTAMVGEAWEKDVRLTCQAGRIVAIEPSAQAVDGDTRVDVLLPALANLHSHSFQRAMAGMIEIRAQGRESFWTWRDLMYRFLERLTPAQIEAIAALAFVEMLEAGYASVGEFHYVHHQPDGSPYAARAELSHRIFAAASETGIGLTHLPVLYTYAGVNQEALAGGQMRFANSVDALLGLVDDCRTSLNALPPDARVGVAPHSLRATSPSDLKTLLAACSQGPVHMHIAEQPGEVADVSKKLGQRPVEWLLENHDVDPRWCLIHATHMTQAETQALARSGAVVGLCPITEANLGDGPFNGATFLAAGGAFGVGSDSNVRISLVEELRMLEYSQRLRDLGRNILAMDGTSTGATLYLGAAGGGAQALGRGEGRIAKGQMADLVAIDRSHPSLCALTDLQLLDGLCFAAPDGIVTDTWAAGRHMVRGGQHIAREQVVGRYRRAISELMAEV